MNQPVIEMHDLHKRFTRRFEALRGLDMAVPAGCVYGLMGRNGAGKTTALRCAMGLLRPTSGTALVLGQDMFNAPREQRARVAYVSQAVQLHSTMSLRQLCEYVRHFYPNW